MIETECECNQEFLIDNLDDEDDSADEVEDLNTNAVLESSQTLLCIICCENPRDILLQPCNHIKLCSICYTNISETAMKNNSKILCPYCREIVQNSNKIYL